MNFSLALVSIKSGFKVQRSGWSSRNIWIELQLPDEYSKMTLPYLYINYPSKGENLYGDIVPWVIDQVDLLADDWIIVE